MAFITLSSLHNLGPKFDIVSGKIADQNIVLLSEEQKSKCLTIKSEDVANVKYKKSYADQISFHTPAALKTLTYVGFERIKE